MKSIKITNSNRKRGTTEQGGRLTGYKEILIFL